MSAHDWLTLAGLVLGSGGCWKLLGKLERLISRVDEVGRQCREVVRAHRKLVERVNDHEARLTRHGV